MSATPTPVDPKTALIAQVVQFNISEPLLTKILLDDRPEWEWSNMYVYSGANVVIEAALKTQPALYNFRAITNTWLVLCPIIIAAFFLASHVLRYMPGLKNRFMAIRKEERLAAVFHLVFLISFSIRIVPQSIWTIHLLWGPSFALQFNNNYKRLWTCAIADALMYVAEGAARSIVRINYFLVAHHILFFVFFFVPMIRNDVWGEKLILLLDWFIVVSELPLYASLLAHRFIINTRAVKVITWLSLVYSIIVRIAELVILIAYFAGTKQRMEEWGDLQMWGWFLALSIPGGFLTCLFSYSIFWWFLRKRDKFPERYSGSRYGLAPAVSNVSSTSTDPDTGKGVPRPTSIPQKFDI